MSGRPTYNCDYCYDRKYMIVFQVVDGYRNAYRMPCRLCGQKVVERAIEKQQATPVAPVAEPDAVMDDF